MIHARKRKSENCSLERCPPTSGRASGPNGGLDSTVGGADRVDQNISMFCCCIFSKSVPRPQHFFFQSNRSVLTLIWAGAVAA